METKSDETSWFKFQGQHYERFLFKTRCLIFRVLPEIYGGIAQLGEHLLCKQGVSGSIPLISGLKTLFFRAFKIKQRQVKLDLTFGLELLSFKLFVSP